jgi:hypothetical protein
MTDTVHSGRLSKARCPRRTDTSHLSQDLVTGSLTDGRAHDDRRAQREFTAGGLTFAPLQRRTNPTAHQPNRHPRRPPEIPREVSFSKWHKGDILIRRLQRDVG